MRDHQTSKEALNQLELIAWVCSKISIIIIWLKKCTDVWVVRTLHQNIKKSQIFIVFLSISINIASFCKKNLSSSCFAAYFMDILVVKNFTFQKMVFLGVHALLGISYRLCSFSWARIPATPTKPIIFFKIVIIKKNSLQSLDFWHRCSLYTNSYIIFSIIFNYFHKFCTLMHTDSRLIKKLEKSVFSMS